MSTQTATRTQIPQGTWELDQIHSKVAFEVRHMGVSAFASQFTEVEATLHGGESAALSGEVRVASVEAGDPQLHGHLLSPDFFDAERYPVLRFEAGSLELADDGSVELTGTLEIKGNRREVTAAGRYAYVEADVAGNEKIGLRLETTVDRRDYGVDWQAELPSGDQVVEWDVEIRATLEFARGADA